MVAHIWNCSTQEAMEEGSCNFKASLGFIHKNLPKKNYVCL